MVYQEYGRAGKTLRDGVAERKQAVGLEPNIFAGRVDGVEMCARKETARHVQLKSRARLHATVYAADRVHMATNKTHMSDVVRTALALSFEL